MRVDARPLPLQPAAPTDAAQIDKVARQMEGLFAQLMIKQMRETAMGDAMFPGAAGQFRDLYDEQIAKSLSGGQGLGLAPMIARQLSQQAGLPDKDAAPSLRLELAPAGASAMLPLDAYTRPLAAKPLPAPAANAVVPDSPSTSAPPALAMPVGRPEAGLAAKAAAPAGSGWVPADAVPRLQGAREAGPSNPTKPAADGPSNARVEAFVAKVWPHAQRVGRELGVDPRAIVAQAALETGWGRSTIEAGGRTANNYFGIKATGGWRGERVTTATQEFAEGAFRTEQASFRAYAGVAQSFADYAALLKRSPRYAGALNAGDDIRGFAAALQRGGYATDPGYARKIEAIATGPTLGRALARLDIDDATGPAAPSARTSLFAGAVGALGGFR